MADRPVTSRYTGLRIAVASARQECCSSDPTELLPHGIEANDLRLRLGPLKIPFQPLDCLRRLDPKIAVVLEGVVVRAAGGGGRGGAAVGGCGPARSL